MSYRPPWKKTNYKAEQIRKAKERQAKAALREKVRQDIKEGTQSTIWQEVAKGHLTKDRRK